MENQKYTILLADDHSILRAGLRSMLSSIPDFDVIGDIPYPIPGGSSEDRYPLMIPWGNEPPFTPNIDGPVNGKVGTNYCYTFVSVDPNDDDIESYIIDWDDNSGIETIGGSFTSEGEITVGHTWFEKGTYTLRAKAKDIYGAESEFGTLTVTIPRNKVVQNSQLLKYIDYHSKVFQLLRKQYN